MRFQWKQVQTWALSQSTLVYAMDQSQTPPVGVTNGNRSPGPWGGAANGGYCAGLVIRWLALRYKKKDYAPNEHMECKYPHWKATRDQNVYEGAGGMDAALAEYGMTVDQSRRHFDAGPATAENILAGVCKRGCYFIGLHATSGATAHALGLEWDDPQHRLFDPNFGHFLLRNEAAFRTFFGDYVDMVKYNVLYAHGTKVLGIDPPRIDPNLLSTVSDSPPGSPTAPRRSST